MEDLHVTMTAKFSLSLPWELLATTLYIPASSRETEGILRPERGTDIGDPSRVQLNVGTGHPSTVTGMYRLSPAILVNSLPLIVMDGISVDQERFRVGKAGRVREQKRQEDSRFM